MFQETKHKLDQAKLDGKRIIYYDEAHFNHNTVADRAYSNPNISISIPNLERSTTPMTLLAAISYENGLEAAMVLHETMNSQVFCQIIPLLQTNGDDFCIFGDNASYHKS